MRSRQGAVLQSLRRARVFLDEHDTSLGLASTDARNALDETIEQLSEQSVMQDRASRGSRGETEKQHAMRFVLRAYHMRPIAEIAKLRLRDVPEFSSLRLPANSIGIEQLLAAASAMADAARPHEKVLVTNGLAPTFIANLQAAVGALRDSIDDRGGYRQKRAGATEGLVAAERRGRAMLKVLDASVLLRVGSDPQLTGEWLSARKIARPHTSSSHETSGVSATSATPPTPSAPESLVTPPIPIAA